MHRNRIRRAGSRGSIWARRSSASLGGVLRDGYRGVAIKLTEVRLALRNLHRCLTLSMHSDALDRAGWIVEEKMKNISDWLDETVTDEVNLDDDAAIEQRADIIRAKAENT